MPLLDRLLLREIAIPLGVGLLAILQLLFILQLLQLNEVVFTSAVTVSDLMRLTAALAPHFLVSAVPLAFMLGVQLGLGRLAADQEVLALSASGTHPLRLYRVPLAIGLGVAVIVAGLTQWAEPWGLQQLNRVLNDVIKRNLQSGLEPGIFNDALPRFMIYVASAELGRIEDVGGPALALRLFRGELHRMEARGETVARFQEGRFLIGVQESVASKNRFVRNEAVLTSSMMRDRLSELQRQGEVRESARLQVEMVRRWAVPLACFACAFLGVPLAVAFRGGRASAYIATLAAFIAFYLLSRFGLALAENGMNAWLAGFLPDLVVLALGGAATLQLVRKGIGKPA